MLDLNQKAAYQSELERVFRSPQFSRAPVMRKLLQFLVNETLAGRGYRLKAYQIAVDALGRDENFDPQSDSYPRVQVGRLRKLLETCYDEIEHDGNYSARRFEIPKGSYHVDLIDENMTSEPRDTSEQCDTEEPENTDSGRLPVRITCVTFAIVLALLAQWFL